MKIEFWIEIVVMDRNYSSSVNFDEKNPGVF